MSSQVESTVVTPKPSILGREPVMWMAVIQAGIALAIAFGFDITMQQFGLIMVFVAAVLGFIARSQVTPVETLPTSKGDTAGVR